MHLVSRRHDWPESGPIDLDVHDLPHCSAAVEWWYSNFHLALADGRDCSLFASFFRVLDESENAADPSFAVTWALVDVSAKQYVTEALLDRRVVEDVRKHQAELLPDQYARRALIEHLDAGHFPEPDALISGPIRFCNDALQFELEHASLRKIARSTYQLDLLHRSGQTGANLSFSPCKPPIRHGEDGVVTLANETMFYYFLPRCTVEGTVVIEGTRVPIATGQGWYDHEFGNLTTRYADGRRSKARARSTATWTWFAVQLSDGREITGYQAMDSQRDRNPTSHLLIVVDCDGSTTRTETLTVRVLDEWVSHRTFSSYVSAMRISAPSLQIVIDLVAEFPEQEFRTIIAAPGFYEARVRATGTIRGCSVEGIGFVEEAGHNRRESHEEFLGAVGRETVAAVHGLLYQGHEPRRQLVVDTRHDELLESYDLKQLDQTVVAPLSELVARGGKAWRSFAVAAVIDAVGGDPNRFRHWLAIPELVHSGSLIVDDVQDDAHIRRGGPAIHLVIGRALAINAGCCSYFLAQLPLLSTEMPAEQRCRWYELYFEAMRAAHAGQAADIAGRVHLLASIARSGDSAGLEASIRAGHRLKSGIAPANVARMAALAGGGTDIQIEGAGQLFEAYGTAFQIVDDVLDFRGFERGTKACGEDLLDRKVTMPVAKAFGMIHPGDRQSLANFFVCQDALPETVREIRNLIVSCGALEACEQEAADIVDAAWQRVQSLYRPSASTVALRACGLYLLQRAR